MPDGNAASGPSTTPNALANFAPKPKSMRQGVGLALSGGGYRAALFHLGAIRRLSELGILQQVTTVSSVSGGSILSAHLATRLTWPLTAPISDWETRIAQPFRTFTQTNIRNAPVFKRYLLPWNWFRPKVQVDTLASEYEKRLTQLKLAQLPLKPNFVYNSTDLAFGVNWMFEQNHIGDYQAGWINPTPSDWPLSRSVAASSCFPPVFDPLPLNFKASHYSGGKAPPSADKVRESICLSDGGVYDNLGLEPIWKDHKTLIVSDGGALFDFDADKNLIGHIKRYIAIPENQALAVRKRWLISNFISGEMEGTYWGVGSQTSNYGAAAPAGYSQQMVTKIAAIRTDLDKFSEAEISILENHGYLLAEAAAHQHLTQMIVTKAPLNVPHPKWMNEKIALPAIEDSWKREILGHFL